VNDSRHRVTRTGSHRFSLSALTGPLRLSPPGRHSPYTGPPTEAQLVALRNLEGIAIQQASPVPDEIIQEADATRRGGFPWQLVAVLVVQAILSARLIWSNTAFADEGLYLWAGHTEWAHWLQGAPIPAWQTWFSGSPVLYPPIGALADTVGGLMGARFLSLAFMLGSTCLLWDATCKLVSRRAAFVATAAFGTLAGTGFLGAFATYDSMALMVLSAGTCLAVRASGGRGAKGFFLLPLAAVVLGVACAIKYAIALFVPVIVLIAFFHAARERGWGRAFRASITLGVGFAVTIAAALALGGHSYMQGIQYTTLSRAAATASPWSVLKLSYMWTAFIVVLAVLAVLISRKEKPAYRWLLRVLALSVVLVPIEQARIDTTVSLHKHVVFGAWFAAMAAGYVLAKFSQVDKTRGWMVVVTIPILVFALVQNVPQETGLYAKWTNLSAFAAQWPSLSARYPGYYLADVDVYHVLGYYANGTLDWNRVESPEGLDPHPQNGFPVTRAGIADHTFSLVMVNVNKTSSYAPYDEAMMTEIKEAGGYRMVANADGIEAWASAEQS
jgi:4-amino-4-deoxy-L-arabinose transferase-like glycosyltransferase